MFFSRKFLPYFTVFFFGAFNDNMFRNALVVMITYQSGFSPEKASGLSFLAMALLMLPFFPFSALAGEAADKFSQRKMFRIVKIAEGILMLLTFAAFAGKSFLFLMILLFLMGTQSAFFSPLKYSYMPRNLEKGDLLRGNGYVNAGTYAAILVGTLAGNTLIELPDGRLWTGGILVLFALAGIAGAWFVPEKMPPSPEIRMDWNIGRSTFQLLKNIFRNKNLLRCTLGLSSFWMTGALYVSQLAGFCKDVLCTQSRLIPLLYAVFSVGVALGSLFCGLAGKKKNAMLFVFPALILMALFTSDLYLLSLSWKGDPANLYTLSQLFAIPGFYRIIADLFFLALCGGFYSVPLNTFLQKNTPVKETARIIAGNNVLNSAAIAVGTIIVSCLMGIKLLSISGVFLVVAAVNVLTAFYLLPLIRQKETL
ncbi:MAG: MFS transporter [Lentisphaeria bacterium]|nr:MFS transporter [Lentisphaeria bacterium]